MCGNVGNLDRTLDVDDEFEESYAEGFSHEPILEPKDTYGLRSLPFRIGSAAFLAEDNIGLEDLPSDSEDELGGGMYDSDEVSILPRCDWLPIS